MLDTLLHGPMTGNQRDSFMLSRSLLMERCGAVMPEACYDEPSGGKVV